MLKDMKNTYPLEAWAEGHQATGGAVWGQASLCPLPVRRDTAGENEDCRDHCGGKAVQAALAISGSGHCWGNGVVYRQDSSRQIEGG